MNTYPNEAIMIMQPHYGGSKWIIFFNPFLHFLVHYTIQLRTAFAVVVIRKVVVIKFWSRHGDRKKQSCHEANKTSHDNATWKTLHSTKFEDDDLDQMEILYERGRIIWFVIVLHLYSYLYIVFEVAIYTWEAPFMGFENITRDVQTCTNVDLAINYLYIKKEYIFGFWLFRVGDKLYFYYT